MWKERILHETKKRFYLEPKTVSSKGSPMRTAKESFYKMIQMIRRYRCNTEVVAFGITVNTVCIVCLYHLTVITMYNIVCVVNMMDYCVNII